MQQTKFYTADSSALPPPSPNRFIDRRRAEAVQLLGEVKPRILAHQKSQIANSSQIARIPAEERFLARKSQLEFTSASDFHCALTSQCGIALSCLQNRLRFLGSALAAIAIANHGNRAVSVHCAGSCWRSWFSPPCQPFPH